MKKFVLLLLVINTVPLFAQLKEHDEYSFFMGIYNTAYGACDKRKFGKKYIYPDEIDVNIIQNNDTTRIIPFKNYVIELPVKDCYIEFSFRNHYIKFKADKYLDAIYFPEKEVYLIINIPPDYKAENYSIHYGFELQKIDSFSKRNVNTLITFGFQSFIYEFTYLRIW